MATRKSADVNRYRGDQEFVRKAAGGELEAWQEFLLRYSTLIYKVVQRHLIAEDDDEVRSVYVDILKTLHDGDLANYNGLAAISTWLILYARRKSIDALRSLHGRERKPASVDNLDAFDGEVFQLYHVERLPIEIVIHTLESNGRRVTTSHLVESIERIENTVDRRLLRRLEHEHWARKNGNGRFISAGIVSHMQQTYAAFSEENSPDRFLSGDEIEEMARRVRRAVSGLKEDEQRIVELRFNHRLEAREISREMGMKSRRQVYTVIDRIVRKLRSTLTNGV